jgi:hypothetical protein
MSRFNFFRFVVGALALCLSVSLLAVDSHGGDKGKDGKGDGKGKKVGQEQIVHGCITAIDTAKKLVTFTHPKLGMGGTVTVDTTAVTGTVIQVCGETKTLTELKAAFDSVKTGAPKLCGIARIDNRTSLKALKIIVCDDGAD